ncbi:MAG: glycosyltransferase family 4 protein, partial [Gemmatimonadales bacterium]
RIDVVHWNFYPPLTNGFLWGLSVARPSLVHILTDHNSRPASFQPQNGRPVVSAIKKLLLKRYAKVLGISDYVVSSLEQARVWSNLDRCHYFVNTDRFAPDEHRRAATRARLGLGDEFVALVVAHLIKEKGVDVAIRACRRLPEGCTLLVAGDGAVAGELRALAASLSVIERVRFLGMQSRVEPLMQAADCLVCPSLWEEAVGLVNLEALASGLAVVASAVGGIPEFIEDGHNGFLVPAGDDGALADRVARLQSDPALRAQMAANARRSAVDRFSIEAQIEGYLACYATFPGEEIAR